jgi:hypothetical protein
LGILAPKALEDSAQGATQPWGPSNHTVPERARGYGMYLAPIVGRNRGGISAVFFLENSETLRSRDTYEVKNPNCYDNEFPVAFKGILQKRFTTTIFATSMVHHDIMP